jgi:CRP/FNR family transcriptional regulator, cyclic AMP receptor protein
MATNGTRRRVRLLEVDPDLGAHLEGAALQNATARLVVEVERVEPGDWDPNHAFPHPAGALGVLVREGLLTRDVAVAETTCAELVGPGDLLRPWDDLSAGAPVPARTDWHVLEPSELMVLDRRFGEAVAQWPEVTTALVTRAVARAQTLAVSLAISCVTGLRIRLLALLWHLADRFGKVGRDGVSVSLPLTHEIVARLVGASRPSVSTALKQLEDEGAFSRLEGGGFRLHGDPPKLVKLVSDRRAAARISAEA